MKNNGTINHRQIAWMTCTVIVAGGLITFPRELLRIAGKDAWFTLTLPVLYSCGVCMFFYHMRKQFPKKHLFQIISDRFGRFGGLVNVVLLTLFWLFLVRDVNSLAYFLNSSILTATPYEMILFLFVLLLMYYGRLGLETAARVNDFAFPFFFVMLLLLPLLLGNEINLELMLPVLAGSKSSIAIGSVMNTGWYGDIWLLGAFLHLLPDSAQTRGSLRHGIALGTLFLTLLVFLNIVVMGPNITGRMIFPNYVLVEQIQVTDFLDRAEILIFSLWFPIFCVKVIVITLALLIGLGQFTANRNYRAFNNMFHWFLLVSAAVAFENITELMNFINYSLPLLVIGVIPCIALLVLAMPRSERAVLQNRKQRESGVSYWYWFTNALFLTALLVTIAGLIFGKDVIQVGNLAGVIYPLCLSAAVITTFREMKAGQTRSEQK